MRACIIFNPTAKGDKARRFRRHLDEFASHAQLKLTAAIGDASRLATESVLQGFDTVIAAGGDGTVNEVLNGLAEAPGGLEQARLALLPLGTVNVFARELGIPLSPVKAWQSILCGKEKRIDLPWVRFFGAKGIETRYFAQLAGAGLDARAVEQVNWSLKRKIGPLAYIWAGLSALLSAAPKLTVTGGSHRETGELVLIGNGRLYGGSYRVFPQADLQDGLLEVVVFPRANWLTLMQCGPVLLGLNRLPPGVSVSFRAETVEITAASRTPLEIDGELAGALPGSFGLKRAALRVCVP
jgi:diacylglycerol kinase (ATP)